MLIASLAVATPAYAQGQGLGECAWPGCSVGGGSAGDPIVPADGEQNITGDLDVSGTISAAALAIDDNATLNAATFRANEGDGSDFTCADDGTTDALTILDLDDTNNTNAWIRCDGTKRLGQIGRMTTKDFLWVLEEGAAVDGFICPLHHPVNASSGGIDHRGNADASSYQHHCYAPEGKTVRFHAFSTVVDTAAADDDEECLFQIECTVSKANTGMTSSKVIKNLAGGDGSLDVEDLTIGQGVWQDLDPLDDCDTWWAVRALDNGNAGTCAQLRTHFYILYEIADKQ